MKTINERRNFLAKMLVAGVSVAGIATPMVAKGGNGGNVLTEEQAERLFFIYQEEKVARDVYIYLGNLYEDESTFASIQLSEQRHIDSAQKLCENYGIDLSSVNEMDYGVFMVPYLQELYEHCIDLGSENLREALGVGVLVEETDIGTLTESIESMDMPDDIIRTYEILREGSYNHLEAYNAAILREERKK